MSKESKALFLNCSPTFQDANLGGGFQSTAQGDLTLNPDSQLYVDKHVSQS